MLNNYMTVVKDFPAQFAAAMSSSQRIFKLIDTWPEVTDSSNPISMPNIKGDIELKNVSFGYDKDRKIIDHVNLHIKPGQMVGIGGESGAGKTTFINVISRLYDPTEGEVILDGVDIKDIKISDVRKNISIVLQDTFLFFIGDLGSNLSGGEKQRICIARALFGNPKILILDEATASVDLGTERKIQNALKELLKNRTTFIIAHRLSTIKNADRIVVINNNVIAEVGTHKELMKKKGTYYDLMMTQMELVKF